MSVEESIMAASSNGKPTSNNVHRVEVRSKAGQCDVAANVLLANARQACPGVKEVRTTRIYLIEASLNDETLQSIAHELLTDPVNEECHLGVDDVPCDGVAVEVHYKPGVMDPVAQSAREAIEQMLQETGIEVRTGWRYHLTGVSKHDARLLARTALANPVIHTIYTEPYEPDRFERGVAYQPNVCYVAIRELDDSGLIKLARDAHLFLSLEEMAALRDYYQSIGREPTDIELETFAQTWSEHCMHKTLQSTIRYRATNGEALVPGLSNQQISQRPGHCVNDDGSVTIDNLLKSTVAAATHQLMESDVASTGKFCVSVFKDNAGIIRLDDHDGIAVKVETHNHPSAIEPYGGAATGIGGCIRDIIGTGLAAKPIANTDTFAVAPPDTVDLPPGVIAPKRILQQVVAGVRDYGNRMGIPTVNGSVYFDPDYLGNPLVFAGCVGLIPLKHAFGQPRPGDRIIVLGGRTGRDGIHGATFSSAELTDTHADEFSHAVQIGNAITEKKMLDVILQARDIEGGPLFHAITDCGAGGFSSAVGETAEKVGVRVTLESAPLKYQGLTYTEIWISEAQERMVLAVPTKHIDRLHQLCRDENVEMCDLGEYGESNEQGESELVLTYDGAEVGRISMALLHEGIPTPVREAFWASSRVTSSSDAAAPCDIAQTLLALLAHPNIASKHWIVRQYDHEVQGGAAVRPLVGPNQDGPSDAAVIRPKLTSDSGVAIGAGMMPGIGEKAAPEFADEGDSYWMALASIDEAVRNVVCVGADPKRIAILDNFCWPSCKDPAQLGALVRAAEACYDGALAYRTPFVSGKDSLNNQFTVEDGQVITIPPTLLITAVGIVADVGRCITMDAKAAGNLLVLINITTAAMGGSHYVRVTNDRSRDMHIPKLDLQNSPKVAVAVGELVAGDLVRSAHDCSDGGFLVAAAEMAFSGWVGLDLQIDTSRLDLATVCFAETPGRYLLEIDPEKWNQVQTHLANVHVPHTVVGRFAAHQRLVIAGAIDVSLDDLRHAWRDPLDW